MATDVERTDRPHMTLNLVSTCPIHSTAAAKLAADLNALVDGKKASFFDAFALFPSFAGKNSRGGHVLLDMLADNDDPTINRDMLGSLTASILGIDAKELFLVNEKIFESHDKGDEIKNPKVYLPKKNLPAAGYAVHGPGNEHFSNQLDENLLGIGVGAINAHEGIRRIASNNGADMTKIKELVDRPEQLEKAVYQYPSLVVVHGHIAVPPLSGGSVAAIAYSASLSTVQKKEGTP